MSTITITRALSKVKILTSQIQEDAKQNLFITTVPNNMIDSESHIKLVQTLVSNHASLESKLSQIIKLKKLIAESNLNTTVNISGKEVTVTEALAMKDSYGIYEIFHSTLRKQYMKANNEVSLSNERINAAVVSNNSDISSSSDIKSEDLEKRLAINTKQLQDNMGIKIISGAHGSPETYIEDIKKVYNDFVSEIDYVLSEHNSTTFIEVE